jgi:hypothetical protein
MSCMTVCACSTTGTGRKSAGSCLIGCEQRSCAFNIPCSARFRPSMRGGSTTSSSCLTGVFKKWKRRKRQGSFTGERSLLLIGEFTLRFRETSILHNDLDGGPRMSGRQRRLQSRVPSSRQRRFACSELVKNARTTQEGSRPGLKCLNENFAHTDRRAHFFRRLGAPCRRGLR